MWESSPENGNGACGVQLRVWRAAFFVSFLGVVRPDGDHLGWLEKLSFSSLLFFSLHYHLQHGNGESRDRGILETPGKTDEPLLLPCPGGDE